MPRPHIIASFRGLANQFSVIISVFDLTPRFEIHSRDAGEPCLLSLMNFNVRAGRASKL